MQDIYKIDKRPLALAENVVSKDNYRITVLTERLVRLEYSPDGVFEDRATQAVLNRDFPPSPFKVISSEDGIELHTSRLHLIYNEKEFSDFVRDTTELVTEKVSGALALRGKKYVTL